MSLRDARRARVILRARSYNTQVKTNSVKVRPWECDFFFYVFYLPPFTALFHADGFGNVS